MDQTDKLLVLEEIAVKCRMPEATIRYKRHRGEMPFLFRMGRRVVAYESEVDAYIREQRNAAVKDPA